VPPLPPPLGASLRLRAGAAVTTRPNMSFRSLGSRCVTILGPVLLAGGAAFAPAAAAAAELAPALPPPAPPPPPPSPPRRERRMISRPSSKLSSCLTALGSSRGALGEGTISPAWAWGWG